MIIDVHRRKLTWLAGKSPCLIGNGGVFIVMLFFLGGSSNCNLSFFALVQTSWENHWIFFFKSIFTETVVFSFDEMKPQTRSFWDNSLSFSLPFRIAVVAINFPNFTPLLLRNMSNFGQYNWNPQGSRSSFRSLWMMVVFSRLLWTILWAIRASLSGIFDESGMRELIPIHLPDWTISCCFVE